MTTEIAKQSPVDRIATLVRRMEPEFKRALPQHFRPDRMARIVMTAFRTTPKLAECSEMSLLGSILTASQLGLEINTPLGQAYLIPYGNTCQLIVGYQGYIDLARRSGFIDRIYAHCVFEGDEFSYSYGLNPTIHHVPSEHPDREDPKKITHVYAVAHQKDGGPLMRVLSRSQVEARRKRSKAAQNGPWVTDYEAMVMKTAVRALWPWMPRSVEMNIVHSIEQMDESDKPQKLGWGQEVVEMVENQAELAIASGIEADTGGGEVGAGKDAKKTRIMGKIRPPEAPHEEIEARGNPGPKRTPEEEKLAAEDAWASDAAELL